MRDPQTGTTLSNVTHLRSAGRARHLRLAVLAAAGLAVAGCAENAPQDIFQEKGSNAEAIGDLDFVYYIAIGVGVIVAIVIAWVIFRYRDRGQPIPEQTHGKPILEIGLTILPALILVGVAIPTVGTLMALNETDDTECIINVTGQQWWW